MTENKKLGKDELLDKVHNWAYHAQDRMDDSWLKKRHPEAFKEIKSIIEQHFAPPIEPGKLVREIYRLGYTVGNVSYCKSIEITQKMEEKAKAEIRQLLDESLKDRLGTEEELKTLDSMVYFYQSQSKKEGVAKLLKSIRKKLGVRDEYI